MLKVPQQEYIKYLREFVEIKSLSEIVKALSLRMDQIESKRPHEKESRLITTVLRPEHEKKIKIDDNTKLKKSSFRDQFMSTNMLLGRPEATVLYVPPSSLPNPNELSKKEEIKFVENNDTRFDEKVIEKQAYAKQAEAEKPKQEIEKPKEDIETTAQKDVNLFKKIGDFFK